MPSILLRSTHYDHLCFYSTYRGNCKNSHRRMRETQTQTDKPHWIQSALESVSVHGLTWYQRTNSKIIRSFFILFSLFILFGLLIWTGLEFSNFCHTNQIKTLTEAHRGNVFHYPNLTVCHSRYFDNQLLKGMLFSYPLKALWYQGCCHEY